MGGRLRKRARRGCLVASGACLALSFAPSSNAQEDEAGVRPEVFRGSASSLVASVEVDREALLPVEDLFRFILLDGEGTYETSTQTARASLLYPGSGLIIGPNLACGTFGGEFPPEFQPLIDACLQYQYPLSVQADALEPDGVTSGSLALGAPGDPVSGNAVGAKAHAAEDASTTDAAIQDLRVLGPVPLPIPGLELDTSVLTIDSATSRTDQRILGGSLVVNAEATLSGVRMIGGLLEIGSLRSVSRVTDDAAGERKVTATLEVSGVTVGGQPAQITDKGLVLGGPASDGPLAQQAQAGLNEVLADLGVRVTVLPFEQEIDREGAGVAGVGGLLVEFTRDIQDLPVLPVPPPLGPTDPNGKYSGSILLGSTGALGSAVTFPVTVADPVAPVDPGLEIGSAEPFQADGAFGGAITAPVAPAPAPASASARPAAPERPADEELARFIGGLFGDRIGLVYLAMCFAVLALCVAPRITLPARLPGPRT